MKCLVVIAHPLHDSLCGTLGAVVRQVSLVLPVKVGGGWLCHAGVSSRMVAKSLQRPRRSVRED